MADFPARLEDIGALGDGSFGTVERVKDTKSGVEYAIKREELSAQLPQLEYESRVYAGLRGCNGVASVYYFWRGETHRHMAMEVLGPSLLDEKGRKAITIKDIQEWIFPQALSIIESIHDKGYLHRDIKPENLLLQASGVKRIKLIDFGLAKKYIMKGSHEHIPFRKGKGLTGTVRYASMNAHRGFEQSRRDDLETLFYTMAFLVVDALPWQNLGPIRGKDKADARRLQREAVMQAKEKKIDLLLSKLPPKFGSYYRYVRTLPFADRPNYKFLADCISAPTTTP